MSSSQARTQLMAGVVVAAGLASVLPAAAESVQARDADGFVDTFGVNIRLWQNQSPYRQDFPLVREKLVDAGFRHVRQRLPVQGEGFFIDAANELAREHGIKHTFGVDTKDVDGRLDISRIDGAIDFGRARVYDATEAYVGPNEYNTGPGGTPKPVDEWVPEFVDYSAALYEKLKRRNGSGGAPPLSIFPVPRRGRSSGPGRRASVTSATSSTRANGHPYPESERPEFERPINQFLGYAPDAWPDRPIQVTETGYHVAVNDPSNGGVLRTRPGASSPPDSSPTTSTAASSAPSSSNSSTRTPTPSGTTASWASACSATTAASAPPTAPSRNPRRPRSPRPRSMPIRAPGTPRRSRPAPSTSPSRPKPATPSSGSCSSSPTARSTSCSGSRWRSTARAAPSPTPTPTWSTPSRRRWSTLPAWR